MTCVPDKRVLWRDLVGAGKLHLLTVLQAAEVVGLEPLEGRIGRIRLRELPQQLLAIRLMTGLRWHAVPRIACFTLFPCVSRLSLAVRRD